MHQFDEKAKKLAPESKVRRRILQSGATVPMMLTLGSGTARANTSFTCADKQESQLGVAGTDDLPLILSLADDRLGIDRPVLVGGKTYYPLIVDDVTVAWYRDDNDAANVFLANQMGFATTPSCDNSFL